VDWSESRIADLVAAKVGALKTSMARVIIGQEEVVDLLVTCLLAGGHALVEGVPGLGKTLLVKSLAQATDMQFRRVQFTPDLMPSDIVGTEILEEDQATRQRVFRFQPGPVFTQVLLADEINRAPPKTQSALLEAMQERSVTFAGHTHMLPRPSSCWRRRTRSSRPAPIRCPKPSSTASCCASTSVYPTEDEEVMMVSKTTHAGLRDAEPAMDAEDAAAPAAAGARHRDRRAPAALCDAPGARHPSAGDHGRGVKQARRLGRRSARRPGAGAGGQSARADAGRLAVTRDDIAAMLLPVLAHRVLRNFEAEADGVAMADILQALRAEIRDRLIWH
jgi:MoxR-like ATPase